MTANLKTENELEKEEKDEYDGENQKNENIAEKYEEKKEENSKSDDVHPESKSYVKVKEENIDEPKIDMPEEPEKENGNKEVTEEDGNVRPERQNSQKGEVSLEPEINTENKMEMLPQQSEKEKGQFENKEENNEDEQKKEEVLEPVIQEEKEKNADEGETEQTEGTVVVKGNLVGGFVNVDEAQPEHNGVKKQVRFDLINEDMNSNHFGINVSVADVVNKVFLVEDSEKHKIDEIYKNFPSSQISGQKFFEDLEQKEKEKEKYEVETEDISDIENTDGALAMPTEKNGNDCDVCNIEEKEEEKSDMVEASDESTKTQEKYEDKSVGKGENKGLEKNENLHISQEQESDKKLTRNDSEILEEKVDNKKVEDKADESGNGDEGNKTVVMETEKTETETKKEGSVEDKKSGEKIRKLDMDSDINEHDDDLVFVER